MESTNTELSGRTGAIFSWLDFLAIVMIILSATAFPKQSDWLRIIALLLLLSGFIYRFVRDWKSGNKKAVTRRLVFFILILVVVALLIYLK